jgi:hypothetical protein
MALSLYTVALSVLKILKTQKLWYRQGAGITSTKIVYYHESVTVETGIQAMSVVPLQLHKSPVDKGGNSMLSRRDEETRDALKYEKQQSA